jgi:uncharacterized protein (DUF2336 family)
MQEILRSLAGQVERSLRLAVAERLAEEHDAPHDLILLLANDEVTFASPILERSQALGSEDLVRLVGGSSEAHRAVIAGRLGIDTPVTAAIVELGGEDSLVALVKNHSAEIAPETFGHLVERAETIERLHAPLVGRSDLPEDCVLDLYRFVSDALRTAIKNSYPIDPKLLDKVMTDARGTVGSSPAASEDDEEAAADRLVSKLYSAGQLTPGFVVKAARDRRKAIFERACASLVQLEISSVRTALYGRDAGTMALLCRAMELDRSVFPVIHAVCREFHPSVGPLEGAERAAVQEAFDRAQLDALTEIKTLLAA